MLMTDSLVILCRLQRRRRYAIFHEAVILRAIRRQLGADAERARHAMLRVIAMPR